MSIRKKRQEFIDRTARRPHGEKAKRGYSHPVAHYKSFRAILEKLQLDQTDRYVEIGCGGGVLLEQALETACSGAAIDHSSDMIEITRERLKDVPPERFQLVEGDAAQLPWADESFSAAACANMFFFVEEPRQVLNEIFRVLQPGGRFAMVTMGRRLLGRITFGWLYSLKTYSDAEMTAMLKAAGFQQISVKTGRGLGQLCYAVRQEV